MYSTCRSLESAGYCDLSLLVRRMFSGRLLARFDDDGVEGVLELLIESSRPG